MMAFFFLLPLSGLTTIVFPSSFHLLGLEGNEERFAEPEVDSTSQSESWLSNNSSLVTSKLRSFFIVFSNFADEEELQQADLELIA